MMSPVIFYTLILGVVEVLQYFLVPLVLNNGTGEPGGATLFYNLYLYKTFFTFQEMSYGATLAWLLFVITLVVHARPVPALPALGLLRRRALSSDGRRRSGAIGERPTAGPTGAQPAAPQTDPDARS